MRVRLGPVSRRRRTDLFVEKAMFRSSRSLATAQEIRFNIYGSESNTFWTIVSWGKVKHRCRAVREHSKSAILMDNNAGTRSSSAFGAEQHLCKRLGALLNILRPTKVGSDRKSTIWSEVYSGYYCILDYAEKKRISSEKTECELNLKSARLIKSLLP